MVGDEDQSIYGFRGAYPGALLNFRYDYTNPFIMRMERNYRSTSQIVEKAQSFISKNKGRYEKNMTAERGLGDEVHLINVANREEQFEYLINIAKTRNKEVAFLYRDNESAVILIDLLLRDNLPIKFKKPEMNVFNSRVFRDIKAYLNLTIDDHDYDSLNRVCNKGILYLKKQQLGYAIKNCRDHNSNVFDALEMQMNYLKREDRKRAEEFKQFILSISSLSPYQAINRIFGRGYKQYLKEKNFDSESVELLKILAKKEDSIKSFLNRLRFLEEQIKEGIDSPSDNPVILSTIHSSKGQEYDTVYMVDVYDGRFPSSRPDLFSRSKDNANGEQEERRLFYVGITRAKNNLYLFSIAQKYSSYIEELFPEIENQRKEKKQHEAKSERQRQYKLFSQRQFEREKEFERKKAELEERKRKEAEILAKQEAMEDQRCYDEILKIIDQQEKKACDSQGRRWIKCERCGRIKLSDDFAWYGGENHINLGTCKQCSEKNTMNNRLNN